MAKRWKRRRSKGGQAKQSNQQFYSISVPFNGGIACVAVAPEVTSHYVEQHKLLPEGLKEWSTEEIHDLAQGVEQMGRETWERVLILLAHHESPQASDLLQELREKVPPELSDFWELAYAESVTWLGYNYVRDEKGQVTISPACMPLTGSAVN
jgi:hypothetical protein